MVDVKEYYKRILWQYEDKEYSIEAAINHLRKYGDERVPGYGNPYVSDKAKNGLFKYVQSWADAIVQGKVPAPSWQRELAEFEIKAYSKWVGPQGATPTRKELMSVIDAYYSHADNITEVEIQPSDHVLHEWIAGVNNSDIILPLSPTELWRQYKGDRKSNSGLTGWTDRRDPLVRKAAISQCYSSNQLDPIVVGSRDQRCKKPCRTIYMDSFANYFREVRAFYWLPERFKTTDSISWRGDRYVERYVDHFLARIEKPLFFEADYEMMDSWLDGPKFRWFLQQCKKVFRFDPRLMDYIEIISSQLFKVELFTPEGPKLGYHSLFSGLFPTNPWESPLNLLIQLMFVEYLSEEILHYDQPMHLGVDFIIVINGDDSLIIFDYSQNPSLVDYDLKQIFADWVWSNFRILANAGKQRVSEVSGFFCKRQYKFQGMRYDPFEDGKLIPKSLYSLTLALNGYLNPEDGALDTKAMSLIKLWQLFDNAYGHPIWKGVVKRVWDLSPELHISVSQDDVEKFNEIHNKNWRMVLFGEKFSLEHSPTAQLWYQLSTK
jgi:hypothetical protein